MRATAYVDQNIISLLDDQNVASVFAELNDNGLATVISHHHLTEICLSATPLVFVKRLEKLQPYFLSAERSAILASSGSVSLEPVDASAEIDWHQANIGDLEQTFLQALFPLLKLAGGLDAEEREALSENFLRSMRSSVKMLLNEFGPLLRFFLWPYFSLKLLVADRQIRKAFSSIDFEADAKKFAEIRRKVASLGNISQIPADEVAATVFAQLDQIEEAEFTKEFPRNFAKDPVDRTGKLSSFAFTLFVLGAVPRSGKVFRGNSGDQKKRFRAQFLDCLHIEEASFFEAFLTCDAGAHRLASVVYSYAGIKTEVRLMTILDAE